MGAGVLTLSTAQHTDGLPGRCTGVKPRLALLPPGQTGAWGAEADSPFPSSSSLWTLRTLSSAEMGWLSKGIFKLS